MNADDKIVIDLDNTITIESDNDYSDKLPNYKIIQAIKSAKKHKKVVIFTARNMRSFNKDINKINEITKPIAIEWLKKNSVEYDEIIFGKPWAGKEGWYVDDRNLSLEEFIFKFDGPFHDSTFDIIIPCFNEEKNIQNTYKDLIKLERLFNIRNIIFVDNGSTDNTLKEINILKEENNKVKSIKVNKNKGYGNGIKRGLLIADGDYVIINHADGQFDAYNFIHSNLKNIQRSNAVIPIRFNRPKLEIFFSFILRIFLSAINLKKVKDFNGQPKIFKLSEIENFNKIPNDFCFDYYIYRKFENESIYLPVIQSDRDSGVSSWKGSIYKTFKIFIRYIYFSLKYKE